MKNTKALITLSIIFIILFSLVPAYSQAPINQEELEENLDDLENAKDILTDEEIRSEYLRKEWTKQLEKTSSGRVLIFMSNIMQVLSPLFKFFLGVEYSLSWFFFICLSLGIWFFIITYKTTREIVGTQPIIASLISIALLGLVGLSGFIRDIVLFFAPLFTNTFITIIVPILVVILWYLSSIYIKKLGAYLRKKKEEAEENKRKERQKIKDKIAELKFKAGDY